MIRFDSKTWLESVGEFLQTPVGRALVWLVPLAAAVVAVLCGLWWGMRR